MNKKDYQGLQIQKMEIGVVFQLCGHVRFAFTIIAVTIAIIDGASFVIAKRSSRSSSEGCLESRLVYGWMSRLFGCRRTRERPSSLLSGFSPSSCVSRGMVSCLGCNDGTERITRTACQPDLL